MVFQLQNHSYLKNKTTRFSFHHYSFFYYVYHNILKILTIMKFRIKPEKTSISFSLDDKTETLNLQNVDR